MTLVRCTRCELNYIQENENLCQVCKRELGQAADVEDNLDLCPLCNEHATLPGKEYCLVCLRELARQQQEVESNVPMDQAIELEPVTAMEEIELELDEEELEMQRSEEADAYE